jgi:tRNA (guanine37-N1)-methyltransferase
VSVRIDVLTIFPELITDFAGHSLLGKAVASGTVDLLVHDLRDVTTDLHRTVDDAPFGGGAGMVLRPEPIVATIEHVDPPRPIIALGAAGRRFDQVRAVALSELDGFTLLCGRYEGIDERIMTHVVDEELSVADVVLAGGEVAALVVIEAVTRLLPGVMGNHTSGSEESFADGLLEYPQFTRPAEFRGWPVPEVLRSGDHGRIEQWRRLESLRRTIERRPDLIEARGGLTPEEEALLQEESADRTDPADADPTRR